jgi:hypothetical protein
MQMILAISASKYNGHLSREVKNAFWAGIGGHENGFTNGRMCFIPENSDFQG